MNNAQLGPGNGLQFGLPTGPQLINQPPRIFGNYNADGSPMAASLNAPLFEDDYGDIRLGPDGHAEQGDPKRRRIARVYAQNRLEKFNTDSERIGL
jgi:hypothetical protein